MDEFINRQEAIEQAKAEWAKLPLSETTGFGILMRVLTSIPAADVRPVVRCKDCKFWFDAPAADGFNSCERDALIRHENFFCAAGEKREGS